MNKEQAYFIAYLRTGPICHSLRRISELVWEYYPEITSEELAGNQLEGQELCRQAFDIIHGIGYFKALTQKTDKRLQLSAEKWEV